MSTIANLLREAEVTYGELILSGWDGIEITMAVALSVHAYILADLGQFIEAEQYANYASRVFEEINCSGRPVKGYVSFSAKKYKEAIKQYDLSSSEMEECILSTAKTKKIANMGVALKIDTAMFKCSMGRAFAKIGQVDRGLPLIRNAVEVLAKHYGNESEYTLIAKAWMASAMRENNQAEKALEIHQMAYEKLKQIYGTSVPKTADIVEQIALDLHEQNKYIEAIEKHREAIGLLEVFYNEHFASAAVIPFLF